MNVDASKTCDVILSHIKPSNLNFSLTESPFSVQIRIRKTFITYKNGYKIPGIFEKKSLEPNDNLNLKLLIENENLKEDIKHFDQEKSVLEEALHEAELQTMSED